MIQRNPENAWKNSAVLCRRATITGFTRRQLSRQGIGTPSVGGDTMRVAPAVMVVAMVALGAGPAEAQTDVPRVLLSVNLGLQPGSEALTDAGTFTLYDEAGALAVSGEASTGALFDLGVALPCHRARHGRPFLPALVQCQPLGAQRPGAPPAVLQPAAAVHGHGRRRRALGERVPFQHRLSAAGHRPARSAHLRRADDVRAVPAGGDVGDRDRGQPAVHHGHRHANHRDARRERVGCAPRLRRRV